MEIYPTRQRAAAARAYAPKVPISIRLDADVVDHFKQRGAKYQREINRVLRRHVERQKRKQVTAG